MNSKKIRIFALGVVLTLMFSGVAAPLFVRPAAAVAPTALSDLHGPYVDTIIGEVITGEDQEALASVCYGRHSRTRRITRLLSQKSGIRQKQNARTKCDPQQTHSSRFCSSPGKKKI